MDLMKKKNLILLIYVWAAINCFADDGVRQQLVEAGLPIVEIITVDGEEPTCDYVRPEDPVNNGKSIANPTKVPGRIVITKDNNLLYDSGDYLEDVSGMTIRIRGNATAWEPQKPFKIKLQKKADLLQRGNDEKYKDKNWLLLRELRLHTKVGYKINELIGLQWTPAYEYVNVMMNGEYMGLYMLTESVRRNPDCRLNVDNTGFIFEYDSYWWNEDVYVKSSIETLPSNYTFKYPSPEDITDQQLDYFTDMISIVEESLYDGTYPQYIDMDSFAAWILAHDILGNWDGAGSNYFLTKYDNTENSKIMMANLWDLDGIFVNENKWDAAHHDFFFGPLLDPNNESKEFINTYIRKWEEISSTIFDECIAYLEDYNNSEEAVALTASIALDNKRWGTNYKAVEHSVLTAQRWLSSRKEWMTTAVANLKAETSGITSLDANSRQKQIYTLDGRRIDESQMRNGIYIVRKDGKTSKIVMHQ